MTLSSAAGLLSLLDDRGVDMKVFALKRLNDLVDEFWAEISEAVGKIEILHEDTSFEYNKLAALLASKVYYHLAEYDDALHFALCAEELFDINLNSEFVETIIAKCIDKYTSLKVNQENLVDGGATIVRHASGDRSWGANSLVYRRLEQVVEQMFDRAFKQKQHKQVLGIAIETRRYDIFEKAITSSDDQEGMLRYAFHVVLTLINNARLRKNLLHVLVNIYTNRALPSNAVNICQCLILMDDSQAICETLERLISQSEDTTLIAYQIAFDLYENASQHFLNRVIVALSKSQKLGHLIVNSDKEKSENKTDVALADTNEATANSDQATDAKADTVIENDEQAPVEPLSEADLKIKDRLKSLNMILSGNKVIELHLQFLIRNNKADIRLLEFIRDKIKDSVTHNATLIANGLMNCGTASDQFLRTNLPWLSKAANWAKFNATATLGVIYKGHEAGALKLMASYLPKEDGGSTCNSAFTEGGGLYALGLIHANHGGAMIKRLLDRCDEAATEPVRHGACLGLGLAAMGTAREDVYDKIRMNLFQDDAVTGEAAGIAFGLVMLGTGSTRVVEEMLSYSKDTKHEKIIRGISFGIAMVMYGRAEEADDLIENLLSDNDANLRWCGLATIAMAYCGTGNNQAIKRLLNAAVSDTNDDVRRWAVTSLGFILFKTPEQVPALVSLLAESYHPHLRFGAAMALGIACAGTGLKDAINLLDSLLNCSVPFVRQGALIASAMVMMQQNGITCPKSVEFRQKLLKIIEDNREDVLVKFGAILACGILDAGGCNLTISLQTRTGNTNMAAAVGLFIFQGFWFWHPLINFISLAFRPTTVIALNKDLNMPKLQFCSNASPSTFAYPQPLQQEKEKKREKVETAVLSITARQRKKEADRRNSKDHVQTHRKESSQKETKMDVDPIPQSSKVTKSLSDQKEDQKEPNICFLNNPARVMRAQLRTLTMPESSRYVTIKPLIHGGILMVQDRNPEDTEQLVEDISGQSQLNTASSANIHPDLAEALGPGIADAKSESVLASVIGAYVADNEVEEEDEDDDDESSELHDEAEDINDEEFEVIEQTDTSMSEVGERKRDKKSSSSRRAKCTIEPEPPEPFLYVDERTQLSGTSNTANVESTSAGSAAPTTTEPMDVDESEQCEGDDKKESTDNKKK